MYLAFTWLTQNFSSLLYETTELRIYKSCSCLDRIIPVNANKNNARNASQSSVATSHRCSCVLATTFSRPFFCLTSLRVCASAAKLLFVFWECLCSLGGHPQVFFANNEAWIFSRYQCNRSRARGQRSSRCQRALLRVNVLGGRKRTLKRSARTLRFKWNTCTQVNSS